MSPVLVSTVAIVCTVALALALRRATTPGVELEPVPALAELDPEFAVSLLIDALRHASPRLSVDVAVSGVRISARWVRFSEHRPGHPPAEAGLWRLQIDTHIGWAPNTTALADLATTRLRAIAEARADVRALRAEVAS